MDYLENIITDWSYADICNDDLFVNNSYFKLNKIPNISFRDLNAYRSILAPFIVEDFRASFKSNITTNIPLRVPLTIIGKANHSKYYIDFDLNDTNIEPESLIGCAIILIQSSEKFTNHIDLLKVPNVIAIIKNINIHSNYFEVLVNQDSLNNLTPELFSESMIDALLYLEPFTPALTAYNSLTELEASKVTDEIVSAESPNHISESKGDMLKFRNLCNYSQIKAIGSVLTLDNSPKIKLIHGPPGTGKSTTLIHIIQKLYVSNILSHITAPTITALKVLAEKFLVKYSDISKVLIVGNPSQLEINETDHLAKFHIHFRRNRIIESINKLFESLPNLNIFTNFSIISEKYLLASSNLKFSEYYLKSFKNEYIIVLRSIITLSGELQSFRPKTTFRFQQLCEIISNLDSESLENYFKIVSDISGHQEVINDYRRIEENICELRSIISNFMILIKTVNMNFLEQFSKLENFIVSQAVIIFSTVSTGASNDLSNILFEVCVVDEASQLVESHTAQVLRPSLKCLVLAGDHKQLSATVLTPHAVKYNYGSSLFERLINNNYPNSLLNIQYRMHPLISYWPNHTFYNGKILNGENVENDYKREWSSLFPPVVLVEANGSEECKETNTEVLKSSLYNEYEIAVIRAIMIELNKTIASSFHTTIGIISPYSAQVSRLKKFENFSNSKLSVKATTVDGCQGQEYDIVIFSSVCANVECEIGVLKDKRRLNVALTRSKYTLIIISNTDTVSQGDFDYKDLFNVIGRRDSCVLNTKNTPFIRSACEKYLKLNGSIKEILNPTSVFFESVPWEFTFTNDFKNSFTQSGFKEKIIKTMVQLSNGIWPKRNELKSNFNNSIYRDLIHESFIEHTYVFVWSIDIIKSGTSYRQYIKIWDIFNSKDSKYKQLLIKIEKVYKYFTSDYIDRCKYRETAANSNRVVPKEWDDPIVKVNIVTTEERNTDSNSLSDNITSLKFHRFSTSIARILLTSKSPNISFPFEMSEEEDSIVYYNGSAIILGRSGTGKTTVMLYRMLSRSQILSQQNRPPRQLFVTASPLLCEAIKQAYENLSQKIVDPSYSITHTFDLIHKMETQKIGFHNIPNVGFPLIVTFKTLLKMMMNTLDYYNFSSHPNSHQSIASYFKCKNELDFDYFRNFIYKRLNSQLQNQLDCSFVYTEFKSVIKGSLISLKSEKGHLSREQYLRQSNSRYSDIESNLRELLYDEFLKYEKLKNEENMYDICDCVFDIYQEFNKIILKDEHTISSVFVDEVQDLNPSEISLLKFLCPSLTEFVYAGDTCQTIAHGVGFRFETLKDIFFYEYLSNDLNIDCKKRLTPNIWELTQNFRTHNGILFLAKSLVDLIIAFFPNTIDKMNPEFSLNNGPKPLFLESSTTGNLITDLFGYSSKTIVDFGAEQVILVRDEEAKARTLQSCDGKALVLTVLESKGMEFDDVLLLGFFSDSPFKDDWRVIYSKFDHDLSSKKFDKKRHSSLNKELKMLYVLVTRAKYRLIIADDDINARKPILDYWKYNKLIDIHVLDDHIRSFFNSKSGPSEWKEKGNIFMSKKQYENAKYCYHRSGDAELEKLAGAHESEMNGDKIFIVNESKAISHYFSAALEFQNLNEFGESARCYENKCKDYKNAAILYEKISKWGKAASCYEKLESYSLATNFYWKDYDLDNAVRISRSNHLYKNILKELKNINEEELVKFHIDSYQRDNLVNDTIRRGVIYFGSKNKRDELLYMIYQCTEVNDKRRYLEKYQFFEQLVNFEISQNNFDKAAKGYFLLNDFHNASIYYEKSNLYFESIHCGIVSIRQKGLNSDHIITLDAQSNIDEINRLESLMSKTFTSNQFNDEFQFLKFYSGIDDISLIFDQMKNINSKNNEFSKVLLWYCDRIIYLINKSKTESTHLNIYTETVQLYNEAVKTKIFTVLDKIENGTQITKKDELLILVLIDYFESKFESETMIRANSLINIGNFSSTNIIFHSNLNLKLSKFCLMVKSYFQTKISKVNDSISRVILSFYNWEHKGSFSYYIKDGLTSYNQLLGNKSKGFIFDTSNVITNLLHLNNVVLKYEMSADINKLTVYFNNILEEICFPKFPYIEDMKAIYEVRLSLYQSNENPLINTYKRLFDKYYAKADLNFNKILRSLLIGSILGNLQNVCSVLRDKCTQELNKRKNNDSLNLVNTDVRLNLIKSFQWEISKDPPDDKMDSLEYSIYLGISSLYKDIWEGSINYKVYGSNKPEGVNERDGCISPILLLKLFEKYTTLLLCMHKNYLNVILTQSILFDVFSSNNSTFIQEIIESVKYSLTSKKRRTFCFSQLQVMFDLIVTVLTQTELSQWGNWFDVVMEKDISSYSSNIILRLVLLLRIISVNLNNKNYNIKYNDFAKMFKKDILKLQNTLIQSLFKNIELNDADSFSYLCAILHDPAVLFIGNPNYVIPKYIRACKTPYNTYWANIEREPLKLILTTNKPVSVQGINNIPEESNNTQEIEEEVVKLELLNVAVDPKVVIIKEYPNEEMKEILKSLAIKAKRIVKSFSPKIKLQRFHEKQLVEMGKNRYNKDVISYVLNLSPLVYIGFELISQLDDLIEKENNEIDPIILDEIQNFHSKLQQHVDAMQISNSFNKIVDSEEYLNELKNEFIKVKNDFHAFLSRENNNLFSEIFRSLNK